MEATGMILPLADQVEVDRYEEEIRGCTLKHRRLH